MFNYLKTKQRTEVEEKMQQDYTREREKEIKRILERWLKKRIG